MTRPARDRAKPEPILPDLPKRPTLEDAEKIINEGLRAYHETMRENEVKQRPSICSCGCLCCVVIR